MRAQFSTTCPNCERPIHVDDEIRLDMYRDLPGFWTHVQCPPEPPKAKVCPLCFMEMALSGEHDCDNDR